MLRNEESFGRIKLAARILVQIRSGGGQPLLAKEIAELRFLAESDEEEMRPVDALAELIIRGERTRIGLAPQDDFGNVN